MKNITTEIVEEHKDKDLILALDFYGEHCGPCKRMLPVYEKIDKDLDIVDFYKVDTEFNKDLISEHGIRTIPTVIFLKKGLEVGRIIGVHKEEAILNKLKEM